MRREPPGVTANDVQLITDDVKDIKDDQYNKTLV